MISKNKKSAKEITESDPSKKYEMWKMEKSRYDQDKQKWSLEKVKLIKNNVVMLEEQAKEFNLHSQESLKALYPQEESED